MFRSNGGGGEEQQLLLSNEGLYNHWWDLTPLGRGLVKSLADTFSLSMWVWFREPVKFAESLYKQCLKNPRSPMSYPSGRDISFSAALDHQWFAQRLDYLGFLEECEALIGEGGIKVFFYDGDTIGAACRALVLPPPTLKNGKLHNTSLSNASIEVLRVINRYPLTKSEKICALERVNELEAILSGHSPESTVTEEEARRVYRMTLLSAKALKAPWYSD